MPRPQVDELLEELGLRLRHTFGEQMQYLGTTTLADEDTTEDVDVLIVLSQLSDAHIRLVWNVVSSVRHTWNVFLDCRMRTVDDVCSQPLVEQFLLKEFLRDCVGENPFRHVKIEPGKLHNECRERIGEQGDRILSLLPSAIADASQLRGIGAATFEAVRAFLVLTGNAQVSKRAALDELSSAIPAFDDLAVVYEGYRHPTSISDLPAYVATALGIVKHLSYRSQGFKGSQLVLLVNTPSSLLPHPMDEAFGYDANMPLGILSVAAYLREAGHEVGLLDAYAMNLTAMGTVDAIVREYGIPAIVGFNPSSPNIHVVHTIARYLKRITDNITIVVGGPHATLATDHALGDSHVDMAIVGEGEIAFASLVESLLGGGQPGTDIPGVYSLCNGNVVGTPLGDRVALERLPSPAFDLLPLSERYFTHRRRAYFHTSRGCAFGCTYCSVPRFWNSEVREIPMEVVIQHIEEAKETLGINEVQIVDDNFSHKHGRRIREFCELLTDRELSIRWKCQVRGDQLDEDLVETMSKAGCFEVDVGIESGSPRVQKEIKKGLDLGRAEQTIETLGRNAISSKAFFILGFPTESWDDIQSTINFASGLKKRGLGDVAFFPAMPFPGTELAEQAEKDLQIDLNQGAVIDGCQRHVGAYASVRLRKYAAMPEVSLTKLLTSRQLRLLCAFAYTCFESGKMVEFAENEFGAFAAEQEAMSYGS